MTTARRRSAYKLSRPFALVLGLLALAGPVVAAADTRLAPRCRAGTSLMAKLEADGRMATIEAEEAGTLNGTGRFWRIEKPGVPPSFLFGTMHLSDPRILALPDRAKDALAGARAVVIESAELLDAGAQAAILAHPELMIMPAGKEVEDYLPPDARAELRTRLSDLGTPYATIQTLQPWFTAMGLMLPPCEAAREAGGAKPLDIDLALKARADGKAVAGLESALDQLQVMASMPLDLQAASLLDVVRRKDELPDFFETMIEFYLAGRIAAITPFSDLMMGTADMPPALRAAYEAFETRIVTDRNRRMAENLKPHLARGAAFVAVGALHLPGRDGLVKLLEDQGFRLSRVE